MAEKAESLPEQLHEVVFWGINNITKIYSKNKQKGAGGGRIDDWIASILHPAPVLIFLLEVGRYVAKRVRGSNICHSLCQIAAVTRMIHWSTTSAYQLCTAFLVISLIPVTLTTATRPTNRHLCFTWLNFSPPVSVRVLPRNKNWYIYLS